VLFIETEFQEYIYITSQQISESGRFRIKIVSKIPIIKLDDLGNQTDIPVNKIGHLYFIKYYFYSEEVYPLSLPFSIKSSKCNYFDKLKYYYNLECKFATDTKNAFLCNKTYIEL